MAWDIRRNSTESIGNSVLPGVAMSRGSVAGRTGVVPRAGSLSFTTDADRLGIGDTVQLIQNGTVEWTGRVRDAPQTLDTQLNAIRWQISASGPIADLVAVEAGAETREYRNISPAQAIGYVLDAIGWAAARRNIGASTRRIAYWRLLPGRAPWEEILALMRTAGPRARFYEDTIGRLTFVDADLPALSRTLYGRTRGTGARAIISTLPRDDSGLDRVVNQIAIPYATIPTVPTIGQEPSRWGTIDLSGHNAVAQLVESELTEDQTAVAFAGYGAFIDGALVVGDEVVPQWNSLYDESWNRTFGSTTPGSGTVTVTSAESSAFWRIQPTDSSRPAVTERRETSQLGDYTARTSGGIQQAVLTQGGSGSNTIALPAGATNVQVTVTQIRRRTIRFTGFDDINVAEDTINVGSASTHFTFSRNGNTITVTPTAAQQSYGGRRASTSWRGYRYAVTFSVTWIAGSTARTWAALHAGIPTGKVEAETDVAEPGTTTIRTAANVGMLRFTNASMPRVVSSGDRVSAGAMLVSACVVEGRLDAAISPTVPDGWTLATGGPSIAAGADANNSRRLLFMATRSIAADGTVPATVWQATGPADPVVHSIIVAMEARRDTVWKDPLAERTINGTVHIDVRDEAPLVNLVTPIGGFDYSLDAGTITNVQLTEGLVGVSVRISITGTNATISGLWLRGNKVTTDEQVTAIHAESIATYERSGSAPKIVPYISRSEAQALADAIVAYGNLPRAAWEIAIDGARNDETMAAAVGVDMRHRIATNIDARFLREGEVLGIHHAIVEPAALLKTRITLLGASGTNVLLPPASAPTVNITAIPDGNEGTAVQLSATLTGGSYDSATYAWSVNGGMLSDATAVSPTWTRPDVVGTTAFQTTLTITVTGDGTNARENTEDSGTDTETAIVFNVLPVAAAPMVAIAPVPNGDENTHVDLSIQLTGGTYDAIAGYAWTVTGGILSNAGAANPRWTRPAVNSDTDVTIAVTVTVAGNGLVARAGTSDTGSDTEQTTVENIPTAPAIPAAPSVTPGNASLAVSWTAPNDGGSPITSYTVRWKLSTDTSWLSRAGISGTSHTIVGLTNGSQYDVAVQAINNVGPSLYSPSATGTPMAPVVATDRLQLEDGDDLLLEDGDGLELEG